MKRSIPNFITTLNLVSGVISVILSVEGYPMYAAWFILIAAVFDFADGFFARLLNATSSIGKQLDSLSDLVSFGLAPAFILYSLLKSILLIDEIDFELISLKNMLILLLPVLIVVFSALRLAKFNVDTRQSNAFIGLPTPANAILIASLPLVMLYTFDVRFYFFILNLNVLIPFIIIQSFLLVSPLPMFALKFKDYSFRNNSVRYIFLILSLGLILWLKIIAMPLIILLYIGLSVGIAMVKLVDRK